MAETPTQEVDSSSTSTFELIIYGGLIAIIVWLIKQILFPKPMNSRVINIPTRAKIEKRDFTREELKEFDGSNLTKPILVSVKGTVFDVSSRPAFYGPGAAYNAFAGRDASRALAMGSTDKTDAENQSLEGLSKDEMESLDGWFETFSSKYDVVGKCLGVVLPGGAE